MSSARRWYWLEGSTAQSGTIAKPSPFISSSLERTIGWSLYLVTISYFFGSLCFLEREEPAPEPPISFFKSSGILAKRGVWFDSFPQCLHALLLSLENNDKVYYRSCCIAVQCAYFCFPSKTLRAVHNYDKLWSSIFYNRYYGKICVSRLTVKNNNVTLDGEGTAILE